MKKLRAYTLLEVLVVMIIMIIIMALGISAYVSFGEMTKFNQDVANVQNDILVLQRAAMFFEKDPEEYWIYGIGIDFTGVAEDEGTYVFFKWCSEFEDFGDLKTTGKYPYFDPEDLENDGKIPTTISEGSLCTEDNADKLLSLSAYGQGDLKLKEDVSITGGQFILFEAVSGRAFVYDENGNLIRINDSTIPVEDRDIRLVFNKNVGDNQTLVIRNLTGRTELIKEGDEE